MVFLPEDINKLIKWKIVDPVDRALQKCSKLHPFIHWQFLEKPILLIDSERVKESLSYIEAGLVDVIEVDLNDKTVISLFPSIVQEVLNLVGTGLVSFHITSTIMEFEEDGAIHYPYQLWELHLATARQLVEP
ncbi:hypothetical protein M5689_011246 [Euphorbia peplus]|nr:hypothetical protein M5689_011246 [Euphorbia peplus]